MSLSAKHVSQRDAELDAAIQQQDRMYVAALVEDAPARLIARIVAQRNDLAREQVAEWWRLAIPRSTA